MKRALITGLQGFTGVYVADVLARQGWQVWGLGQTPAADGVSHYRCVDMLDRHALLEVINEIRPSAVVHLAGVAAPAHGDVDMLYRVNIVACRNLLDSLRSAGMPLQAVVLASSAYVYGNATEGMLSEASAPNPGNDYAVSKLAMEHMARLWMPHLPIVIVRPFNYTGVGQTQTFLLPKIVAHFKRAEPVIELGNVEISRDFSDVRSVADVYGRLLQVPPIGQSINICSGKAVSIAEIVAMAEKITGHRIKVEVNPEFVRANDVTALWGDPTRMRSLMGDWQPIALFDTLSWMLQENTRAN